MNILLYPNRDKDSGLLFTQRLYEILEGYGANVFGHISAKELTNVQLISDDEISNNIDLIVTIGGDGTFLQGAHYAFSNDIPIIGFNMGHVGFLAELEVTEIELLKRVLSGDFEIDERMLINVKLLRGNEKIFDEECVNEVVIHQGNIPRILDIDLSRNGKMISHYRADGMLVCTSTGSTAYSLSAGGPIIDPSLKCLSMVPICAHSIASRPVIFAGSSKLTVTLSDMHGKDAFVAADGHSAAEVKDGDVVIITESKKRLKVVKLKDLNFYEVLRIKMYR
ncbi:MAG: NAD(+)/NADH kinase [Bacillota bacterium]|nr:NAD(+)/NADH kinase [Bacillota bacterium]